MKDLEKAVYKFLKDRKWDNLRPSDISKSIMIEGAELLELFQWENLSLNDIKADKDKIEGIKKELADVLIYSLQMSVLLGFDTEKIVKNKLELAEKKYNAELMLKRSNKEPGADSEYLKIKKQHRMGRE